MWKVGIARHRSTIPRARQLVTDPFERFDDCCRTFSRRPAVVAGDRITTYAELGELSRRIGSWLAARYQEPRIGIFMPKSAETYASFFGTLAAGGYYAPLNTDAPPARNALILSVFDPDLVLTSRACAAAAREAYPRGQIVPVEDLGNEAEFAPRIGRLAYVMFTSGSTGVPKGVMISRRALAHFVDWVVGAVDAGEGDRWSQHPNIGFDMSVFDIYGALSLGATLYPLATQRDNLLPARFIGDHRITIWNSVPSVVDLMTRARQLDPANLSSLRIANFCGEPLLGRHVEALFEANRSMLLQNTYGPTEATVSCTHVPLSPDEHYHGSIELGDPIAGMSFLIDDNGTIGPPAESGQEGELLIVGPQLAEGYWNDPARTAQSFVEVPLSHGKVRAYRTGDRVAIRAGRIHFLSRIDDQIKLRGYRLELEEVDNAISALGMGIACTVKVGEELHTFIETETPLEVAGIVAKLKQSLPDYAIPAGFHALSLLPRNANDKLDRLALRALAESAHIKATP